MTVRHHGHPDSLMQATGDLLAWAESEGLEFDQEDTPEGHAWASRTEWYYSDPVEVPDLNDWETELAFKLRYPDPSFCAGVHTGVDAGAPEVGGSEGLGDLLQPPRGVRIPAPGHGQVQGQLLERDDLEQW